MRWDPKSNRLFADADDGRARGSHFALVTKADELPEPLLGDPFHGTPHEIPVRIEAEDYDLGGEGV